MKTLAKEHGIIGVNQNPPNVYTIDSFSQGWRILNPAGIFVSDTYFDLAGLTQREKTLFFEGAAVQDMLNPTHNGGGVGDSLLIIDIMTVHPLTDTELTNFIIYGNFAGPNSVLTFHETIYARFRQYAVDIDTAAWGSYVLLADNQIGSLQPTASDRIYSYRIVQINQGSTASDVDIFAARHVIQASVKTEEEYQYLMRLKRSYELQQSYDED